MAERVRSVERSYLRAMPTALQKLLVDPGIDFFRELLTFVRAGSQITSEVSALVASGKALSGTSRPLPRRLVLRIEEL